MKKIIPFILMLCFSLSIFAKDKVKDTVNVHKTRNYTIGEAFVLDSIESSPLMRAFDGVGIEPVKEAFKQNRMAVDSILAADSLNPTFWRKYSYQAVNLFAQANKSPSMAMAIFLPLFLLIFLIVVVALLIKTFLVHPVLLDPVKPENDPNASEDVPKAEDNQPSDENTGNDLPENEGKEAGKNQ